MYVFLLTGLTNFKDLVLRDLQLLDFLDRQNENLKEKVNDLKYIGIVIISAIVKKTITHIKLYFSTQHLNILENRTVRSDFSRLNIVIYITLSYVCVLILCTSCFFTWTIKSPFPNQEIQSQHYILLMLCVTSESSNSKLLIKYKVAEMHL